MKRTEALCRLQSLDTKLKIVEGDNFTEITMFKRNKTTFSKRRVNYPKAAKKLKCFTKKSAVKSLT